MTFPGKNYPGQRGFPTPNSTPSETRRRIFVVPADAEWLGLVMGAVEVLREEWRWYEWGALTPAEAAAAFNTIIIDAFENVCPPVLPGGGRVIRINPTTGKLEEGADDGTWQPPTGDYAVPPITPREGTPDDIRCLAAANAAHVLELLYESVTDSIAHELELSEAYAALITAFIAAVGWEFAPIAFALATFFLAVFAVVYEIVKIIGADLWDGTFTDTLKCALYGCSSADGEGVVTFDWPCVQNALAAGTDALNFDQLRLFNQLNFMIQVIGGADGLNQAGATTAITDADCSGCDSEWCYFFDFSLGELGWSLYPAANGSYDSGNGWVAGNVVRGVDRTLIDIVISFAETTITGIGMLFEYVPGEMETGIQAVVMASQSPGFEYFADTMPYTPPDPPAVTWTGSQVATDLYLLLQCSINTWGGAATIKQVTIHGLGVCPFGTPNC